MRIDRLNGSKQIVNFTNIDYLKTKEGKDCIELLYTYQPKIKKETLTLQKVFVDYIEVYNYLNSLGFHKLNNIFINVSNIAITEEKTNDMKRVDIELYMRNGSVIELNMRKIEWDNFKNSKLV